MQLRHRLVLLVAGSVGMTVLLASIACYFAMRSELYGQVDKSLTEQARLIQRMTAQAPTVPPPRIRRDLLPEPRDPGEATGVFRLLDSDGNLLASSHPSLELEASATDRSIARGGRGRRFSEREVGGLHLRVLTVGVGARGAVQLARSLRGADETLGRLRYVLALIFLLGTVFAVLLARGFARKVIEPVREIDDAADHIGETQDLTRRITATGDDEVGRMARRFNSMLDALQTSQAALAGSVAAQRQLVADASHELRTPMTSLRTNIELLLNVPDIDSKERQEIHADLHEQATELSELIGHIIELARGAEPIAEREELHLDEIVSEALARARRHAPHLEFRTDIEATTMQGDPERLARAVSNLLDNAAKYADTSAGVDVTLRDGILTVRDHGRGIPEEDRPHIFDRFYRGPASQHRPGSGLGLAIVRQAAEAHDGTVEVRDADDGGAEFRILLPTARRYVESKPW